MFHVSKVYVWDGKQYVGLPGNTYVNPHRMKTIKTQQLTTYKGVEKNRKRKQRVQRHD